MAKQVLDNPQQKQFSEGIKKAQKRTINEIVREIKRPFTKKPAGFGGKGAKK